MTNFVNDLKQIWKYLLISYTLFALGYCNALFIRGNLRGVSLQTPLQETLDFPFLIIGSTVIFLVSALFAYRAARNIFLTSYKSATLLSLLLIIIFAVFAMPAYQPQFDAALFTSIALLLALLPLLFMQFFKSLFEKRYIWVILAVVLLLAEWGILFLFAGAVAFLE